MVNGRLQAGKVTAFYKEKIVQRMVACICDTAQYRPNERVSLDDSAQAAFSPIPTATPAKI